MEREPGGCLAVLAVVVVVVVVVVALGGWIVGAASPQPALGVGPVRVQPPLGWVHAGTLEAASREAGPGLQGVRLTDGTATLVVLAGEDADAAHAMKAYSAGSLERRIEGLVTSPAPREARAGTSIAAQTYTGQLRDGGSAVDGEVTAVVSSGRLLVFDGYAPEGMWTYVREEVEAIIGETASQLRSAA